MLPGRWGPHSGHGVRASIRPLREGGAARWKTVAGVHIRSGWKGRRGEYCGWPSRHASAWFIRKGLEFCCRNGVVLGCDGPPQYSPRRAPCRLSFASHGHPIHGRATPLSEGGSVLSPSLCLAFVELQRCFHYNSRGTFFLCIPHFCNYGKTCKNRPFHPILPTMNIPPPSTLRIGVFPLSRFRNRPPDGVTSPPCVSPGARWRCGSRGRFSRRGCSRTTRSSRCRRVPSRDCPAATP